MRRAAYPDALTRRAAAALARATTVRFDLSDLQPPAFGATAGRACGRSSRTSWPIRAMPTAPRAASRPPRARPGLASGRSRKLLRRMTADDDQQRSLQDEQEAARKEIRKLEEADEVPSDPREWPDGKAKFLTYDNEGARRSARARRPSSARARSSTTRTARSP